MKMRMRWRWQCPGEGGEADLFDLVVVACQRSSCGHSVCPPYSEACICGPCVVYSIGCER